MPTISDSNRRSPKDKFRIVAASEFDDRLQLLKTAAILRAKLRESVCFL
jgi:hypothetical protein